MHPVNQKHLDTQAELRRQSTPPLTRLELYNVQRRLIDLEMSLHLAEVNKTIVYIEGEVCLQCGEPATNRNTDLRWGEPEVSFWCDTDFDAWWHIVTYGTLRRDGHLQSIDQGIIPAEDVSSQLEGWDA